MALLHPFHWDDVPRGGERYLRDLAWYLAGRGHRVDVIVGTREQARVEDYEGARVEVLRVRLPARLASQGLRVHETFGAHVLPLLLRRRYDVVHALVPAAAIAARLAGQRVVYTFLGHPTPEQFAHRPKLWRLISAGVRAAQCPTAFSDASARAVTAMTGQRCLGLPLGVRLADFPTETSARSGPPRLLFAGFPGERRKGIDLALTALGRVLEVHPEARLLVPGTPADRAGATDELDPVTRDRVLAATDDLGVLPMSAMGDLYRSATVSLLPAVWEAFGVSLVESLASGTPVVCSDDGGMPAIVGDSGVGVVVPPRDAGALAEGLLAAIELARQPGTPARAAARSRQWGWAESVGPLHERVYAELRAGRHP